MTKNDLIVVTGAGGFIGGHLVAGLRGQGYQRLRAVDLKPLDEWYQRFDDVENLKLDLSRLDACQTACEGATQVYNLAADMGGMGFIELNKALCMLTVLINTHMLAAARDAGVRRFFFSSSACVYAAEKQTTAAVTPLREPDAYPAMPEDGYGWEKLLDRKSTRLNSSHSRASRMPSSRRTDGAHPSFWAISVLSLLRPRTPFGASSL